MLVRRAVAYAPRRSLVKHSQKWHIRSRPLSTASSAAAAPPPQPMPAPQLLASISSELDRRGPRIDLHADQIRILYGPKEFYATLKDKIRGAKRRIFLATLYVGREEHELMDTLREALAENPGLQVSVLTDALRGTRESPQPSCASLLASLAVDFPDRVEVLMYHTSNLTGLRKRLIPTRINEGWGLQHMKLYGIDDEIILSGANLSRDYFTNRQDRYHLISSAEATDYFHAVYAALRKLSWSISPQNRPPFWAPSWPARTTTDASALAPSLIPQQTPRQQQQQQPPQGEPIPSPLANRRAFDRATDAVFAPLLEPHGASKPRRTDTALYPQLILPRAQNTELPALRFLLSLPLPRGSHYLFTAGYFNPHPDVTASLLALSASGVRGTVLTASPWANGFFGSSGVSGMLPAAYTLLARRFLRAADAAAPGAIGLREWRLGTVGRPHGWTYHAKGLWVTLGSDGEAGSARGIASEKPSAAVSVGPADARLDAAAAGNEKQPAVAVAAGGADDDPPGPAISVLGSSNYTVRSYSLDTEAGAVLITENPQLQRALRREADNLLEHSRPASDADLGRADRRAGPLVRAAMAFVRLVGGSL